MTRIAYPLGIFAVLALLIEPLLGYNILMATMGGTKSHTVPFVGLGTSLRSRGHNVTLLSAFTGPAANNGLHELVPPILEVIYVYPLFLSLILYYRDFFFSLNLSHLLSYVICVTSSFAFYLYNSFTLSVRIL